MGLGIQSWRWIFTVEISADSQNTKIGDTGAFGGAASFDEITVVTQLRWWYATITKRM